MTKVSGVLKSKPSILTVQNRQYSFFFLRFFNFWRSPYLMQLLLQINPLWRRLQNFSTLHLFRTIFPPGLEICRKYANFGLQESVIDGLWMWKDRFQLAMSRFKKSQKMGRFWPTWITYWWAIKVKRFISRVHFQVVIGRKKCAILAYRDKLLMGYEGEKMDFQGTFSTGYEQA